MTPRARAIVLVLVLAPLTACTLDFGDDCDERAYPAGAAEALGYRNPETGACEYYGGGGGEVCGGGYYDVASDPAPLPDWARCPSECEGLGETACLAYPSCRAAYIGTYCPPGALCPEPQQQYYECWGVAPTGPVPGGGCWGLDAYGCSLHDDCSAVYGSRGGELAFLGCQPEGAIAGCYSDAECPVDQVCTASTECLPPPGCEATGTCEDVCYGRCVPSMNACAGVFCEVGYQCEEECWPCDGTGDCAPYCTAECRPNARSCATVLCGTDQTCVERCHPCDPLPDGTGCEDGPWCEAVCEPAT